MCALLHFAGRHKVHWGPRAQVPSLSPLPFPSLPSLVSFLTQPIRAQLAFAPTPCHSAQSSFPPRRASTSKWLHVSKLQQITPPSRAPKVP